MKRASSVAGVRDNFDRPSSTGDPSTPMQPEPRKLPAPLTPTSSPMDVARCDELNLDERRSLLVQWQADEVALERARGEGMDGNGESHITEVAEALETLDRLAEEERLGS